MLFTLYSEFKNSQVRHVGDGIIFISDFKHLGIGLSSYHATIACCHPEFIIEAGVAKIIDLGGGRTLNVFIHNHKILS